MLLHLLECIKISIIRRNLRLIRRTSRLRKMLHHFCLRNRHFTVRALLNVLHAVVVMKLKRLLCHFLRAVENEAINEMNLEWEIVIGLRNLPVIAEHVGLFGAPRDKGIISVFFLQFIYLLLSFCRAGLDLRAHVLVLFPQPRNHLIRLLQLLLQLIVFIFQK